MQFVFRDGYAERELELRFGHPEASVADLASALGLPGSGLCIDGRTVGGDLPLAHSGLVVGATVEHPRWVDGATDPRAVAVLRVVGGLTAGASVPLPAGRVVLGRGERAQIHVESSEVSREHCLLEISPAASASVSAPRENATSGIVAPAVIHSTDSVAPRPASQSSRADSDQRRCHGMTARRTAYMAPSKRLKSTMDGWMAMSR